MENEMFPDYCSIHMKKVVLICTEERCNHNLLCHFCFKNHPGDHLKHCFPYADVVANNTFNDGVINMVRMRYSDQKEKSIQNIQNITAAFEESVRQILGNLSDELQAIQKDDFKGKIFDEIDRMKEGRGNLGISDAVKILNKLKLIDNILDESEFDTKPLKLTLDTIQANLRTECTSILSRIREDIMIKKNVINLSQTTARDIRFGVAEEIGRCSQKYGRFFLQDDIHIVMEGDVHSTINFYQSRDNFVRKKLFTSITLDPPTIGTYHVYSKGFLFYFKVQAGKYTKTLVKYSLYNKNAEKESEILENAIQDKNQQQWQGNNDLILILSNSNLYVVYCCEENQRRISIALINSDTLKVIKIWHTDSLPKHECGPIFMVGTCLFHMNHYAHTPTKAVYCYDLVRMSSYKVDFDFPNKGGHDSSLYYDEINKCMFTVNNGIVYKYSVNFV